MDVSSLDPKFQVVFGLGQINFKRVTLKMDMGFEMWTLMFSLFHSSIVKEITEFSKTLCFILCKEFLPGVT